MSNLLTDVFFAPEEAEKLRLVDKISLARLRELAEAEREGRLVIRKPYESKALLPCTCGNKKPSHWYVHGMDCYICDKCENRAQPDVSDAQARRNWNSHVRAARALAAADAGKESTHAETDDTAT